MTETEFIVVLVTVGDEGAGQSLARTLVEEHLALARVCAVVDRRDRHDHIGLAHVENSEARRFGVVSRLRGGVVIGLIVNGDCEISRSVQAKMEGKVTAFRGECVVNVDGQGRRWIASAAAAGTGAAS